MNCNTTNENKNKNKLKKGMEYDDRRRERKCWVSRQALHINPHGHIQASGA